MDPASPSLLILVPARAGSKGVPGKNVKLLGGVPLLGWTARIIRSSGVAARAVLSTDDPAIVEVGRAEGLETPFLRPTQLAGDRTDMIDVVEHAVAWLESRERWRSAAIMVLQPTCPFRRAARLAEALTLLAAPAPRASSASHASTAHPPSSIGRATTACSSRWPVGRGDASPGRASDVHAERHAVPDDPREPAPPPPPLSAAPPRAADDGARGRRHRHPGGLGVGRGDRRRRSRDAVTRVRVLLSARDPGGAATIQALLPALRDDPRADVTVAASGAAFDVLTAAGETVLRFALADGATHVPTGGPSSPCSARRASCYRDSSPTSSSSASRRSVSVSTKRCSRARAAYPPSRCRTTPATRTRSTASSPGSTSCGTTPPRG